MEETKVLHKKKVLAPKLRFNGFTEPWKPCTLGDVTQYTKGFAFKSDDYRNDGVRIIRVSDLGADRIRTENEKIFISTENINLYNKYRLISGNIIITTVGSKPELLESAVGRGIFVQNENEGLLNQNLLKFENIKDVDNGFLMGQINSKKYQLHIKGIARGNANQANITVVDLLQYKFNIPSYPEQQKIASFLSAVDEKIQLLNHKKQLLEQYKKGVMQQLFSGKMRFKDVNGKAYPKWEEKKLGDTLELLTDFEANGSFASVKENVNIFDTKNYAWYVRATDLENKTQLSSVKYVDEHSYNFLKKTPLFGNELLITKRGEIGKVYFFAQIDGIKATVAPNMYLLKFKKEILPKFYFYYFTNKKGNGLLKRIDSSSTLGALYKDDVKNIKTMLPIIEEQKKIADFLSAIDLKIESLSKQINQTQNFKKGLLQQMFV